MPTPSLPDDVLAHIVTFISIPSDLLSASLADRTLAALAKPELAYRSIRCHLSKDNLWVYLVANPVLAARVRELEILYENPVRHKLSEAKERVPGGIPQPGSSVAADGGKVLGTARSREKSEKLLIAALRVLVNLEKFTWDHLESTVNQGKRIPLELLETGDERAPEPEIYGEDVWTTLRDYTHLRELKVADLGRWEIIRAGGNVPSVYASKIWSIVNLTSLDLKIYYAPPIDDIDHGAGIGGGGNDNEADDDENEDDDTGLLPGRINTFPLYTFLISCPNLEHLKLAIHDRSFYTTQNGNPYTNLTHFVDPDPTHWPRLSTLCLADITIDNHAMAQFLAAHPRLRVLSAFLSLNERGLPQNPFTLDGPTHENFLPVLEEVGLPPESARTMLKALSNPVGVKAVRILEPRDWGVEEGDELGAAEVEGLDDVWGVPEADPTWERPEDRRAQTSDGGTHIETCLLKRMTGLITIVVKDVRTIDQLGRLADVAPQLEVVRLIGKVPIMIQYHSTSATHLFELLSHLSKWRRLTSFTGIPLWGQYNKVHWKDEREMVEALAAACPLLREVTWAGGWVGVLVRDEQGRGVRVDVKKD